MSWRSVALLAALTLLRISGEAQARPALTTPRVDDERTQLSGVAGRELAHLRWLSQVLAQQRRLPARVERAHDEAPWIRGFEDHLARELLLLERFAVRFTANCERGELPEGQVLSIDLVGSGSTTRQLELPEGRHRPLAVRLENTGNDPVVDAKLIVNDHDWSDMDALALAAVAGLETPAAKAEALWSFVVDNRRHDQPAHEGPECHDPVKLLNVYGYGLCDDTANVLANLARHAGLEARVWALEGHVVTELRYDDAWHMFDADQEACYRTASGEVASLAQLAADPSLLTEAVRPLGREPYPLDAARLAKQITSTSDNRHGAYPAPDAYHDMGFVLRPGERVTLYRGHWGYRFAEGRFRFPIALANGTWHDRWPRTLGGEAVERSYALPWPIVGGVLRVHGVDERAVERARLSVMAGDGTQRTSLVPAWHDGVMEFDLDLGVQLGSGDPDYGLALRLSGSGIDWSSVAVDTQLVFQHAPLALPALDAGTNNVRVSARAGTSLAATLVYATN